MAQKVNIVLVDDVDGGDADETVSFALDNVSYEIDLSEKNAKALRKALDTYVSAARKVGGRKSPGSSTRRSSGSGRSKEELAEIRAWAQQNGHQVSERGRIKAEVLEAYDAAN